MAPAGMSHYDILLPLLLQWGEGSNANLVCVKPHRANRGLQAAAVIKHMDPRFCVSLKPARAMPMGVHSPTTRLMSALPHVALTGFSVLLLNSLILPSSLPTTT
jgi:hypothetical protein